jgi:hypothetical protein
VTPPPSRSTLLTKARQSAFDAARATRARSQAKPRAARGR